MYSVGESGDHNLGDETLKSNALLAVPLLTEATLAPSPSRIDTLTESVPWFVVTVTLTGIGY